jgi:hypothetical protein
MGQQCNTPMQQPVAVIRQQRVQAGMKNLMHATDCMPGSLYLTKIKSVFISVEQMRKSAYNLRAKKEGARG